jgi:thiamine biosynthesis lipoprotein
MGTVAEVAVPARNEIWAQRAIDAALAELRRVEAVMSRFRSDSDVGRLNAGGDGWVGISPDTAEVLRAALGWAVRSGGRFDPCLGRLTCLWDGVEVGAEVAAGALTGGALAAGRGPAAPGPEDGPGGTGVRWRALEIDAEHAGARARLSFPVAVDLGGIAKGFAVDVAAEALRGQGVIDGLVNVGGDLVALGSDVSGEPWRIGVRAPDDPRGLAVILDVTESAVATSGDYVRFFESGGRRYHHLLDPATGASRETAMRSLTVRADRCMDADAAATALFGAPPEVARDVTADSPVHVIHTIEEVTT